MMLLLFSIEDVRKKRIDILPLLAFSVIGAIYQTVTRALTIPEICGGMLLGVGLLGIAEMTGESLGYGDGLLFLVTGIYLGGVCFCHNTNISAEKKCKIRNSVCTICIIRLCVIFGRTDHMKKSLKASYTVEASMLMPLVLFFIFQGFALGISLCQEVQKASVYSARLQELSGADIFKRSEMLEEAGENIWK